VLVLKTPCLVVVVLEVVVVAARGRANTRRAVAAAGPGRRSEAGAARIEPQDIGVAAAAGHGVAAVAGVQRPKV